MNAIPPESDRSIAGVLKHLLGGTRHRDAPEATVSGTPDLPTTTKARAEPLAERLQRLAAGRDLVGAGRLQLLGLGPLKDQLGSRWDRFQDTVHNITANVLRQRLAQADVFTRHGDTAWIVVFADLTGAEAKVKAALIAQEIEERILGDAASQSGIRVGAVVRDIDGSLMTRQVDVCAALEEAFEAAEADDPAGDRPGTATSRHAPRGGDTTAGDASRDAPATITPVWDVKRKAIITFLVEARAIGREVTGTRETVTASGETELCLEMDLCGLSALTDQVDLLSRQEKQFLLMARVSLETLASGTAQRTFLRACGSLSERWRQYVVFEVDGVPSGVAPARIQSIVNDIRPFARAVRCRVPMPFDDIQRLSFTGLEAVGYDLRSSKLTEALTMPLLDAMAASARRARMRCFAHGIDSLSMATVAVCAGFDYLSGDAIHKAMPELDAARRYEPHDLIAHMLR